MLSVTVGHSADIDLDVCIEEVIAQVGDAVLAAPASAGLLFVSQSLDHAIVVARLREAFPDLKLVGCASDGEASGGLGFQDDSILLVVLSSPDLGLAIGVGRNASASSEAAADAAVTMVRDQLGSAEPSLCFMFVDSLRSLPDLVLRRVVSSLGGHCKVVGGGANPSSDSEATHVFYEDEVLDDAVVLLALAGDVEAAITTFSSWQPIGSPGRITEADGRIIHRINDRPAVEFYTRELGVSAQSYIGVPLALIGENGDLMLRAPFLDPASEGALRLASEVEVGQEVRVCYATVDDILDGAAKAAEQTKSALGGGDPAVLLFCSCVVRKMFLSMDVETEIDEFAARFGGDVPVVGFYGYGEIGGMNASETARFHNQAIVALAVR